MFPNHICSLPKPKNKWKKEQLSVCTKSLEVERPRCILKFLIDILRKSPFVLTASVQMNSVAEGPNSGIFFFFLSFLLAWEQQWPINWKPWLLWHTQGNLVPVWSSSQDRVEGEMEMERSVFPQQDCCAGVSQQEPLPQPLPSCFPAAASSPQSRRGGDLVSSWFSADVKIQPGHDDRQQIYILLHWRWCCTAACWLVN